MIPYHPSGKKLSSNELRQLKKDTRQYVLENFDKEDFDNIPMCQIGGYSFFAKEKDVIPVIYDEKTTLNLFKAYTGYDYTPIAINGDLYHPQSPLVVRTRDTSNYILRKDSYPGYGNRAYEKKDDLVFHEKHEVYFPKNEAVTTEDTETVEWKGNVFTTDSGKSWKYKRMSMPTKMWDRAPYIDETVFPKKITDRRIGVEYEFGNTFKLFKPFLKSKFKEDWFSTRDGSLDAIDQGIEFVSIPFSLKDIDRPIEFLEFAKANGAQIPKECGYHVHIGASDLNFIDISTLITLCTSIEDDMFKLGGTGRSQNTYCKPLSERFYGFQDVITSKEKNKFGDALYKGMNANFKDRHKQSKYADARNHTGIRYYWVNIDRFFYQREKPEQKTVEFRNHKATWDGEDFKNFMLLCFYIVEFAKTHSKKTCKKASLFDVVNTSHLQYRKRLTKYIKKYI